MKNLICGLHRFQSEVFLERKELFQRLSSQGQSPDALFVTCSDSRVNPNLITQTDPGELFILRNAGNIIPPFGAPNSGEEATIEFALVGLGVRDIIVCGHSHCGAVKALLNPEQLENMPAVSKWLQHAEATRRIVQENYAHVSDKEQLVNIAIQENVLVQLENLRTHPAVASRLARRTVNLHAWIYKIETGQIFAYDPEKGQFLPITDEQEADRIQPRDLAVSSI